MRLVGFFFDHSSSRLGESIRSAAPTWPRAATTSSSAETAPVPSVRRAATVRFFFRGPSLGSRPHLEITPTPHLVRVCVCACVRVCVCVCVDLVFSNQAAPCVFTEFLIPCFVLLHRTEFPSLRWTDSKWRWIAAFGSISVDRCRVRTWLPSFAPS